MADRDGLRRVLRERFGHDEFRPGQLAVIENLLGGRDALAVLPTGAGKSLVYQLTAQVLPGATVVVSPLIALMRDQVDSLEQRGIDVGVVNSTLSAGAVREELSEVIGADAKLLYVTPERFENEAFMAAIRKLDVSLFVIDEAHCVSEWGHSFRPSYLGLREAATRLGRPPVLALTATATPWVRDDIVDRLGLRDPAVVVRGVDRPNLFFEVCRVEAESEDRAVLQRLLTDPAASYPAELAPELETAMAGSGIVYTATTRAARETAEWLQGWGIAADYYHGQRKAADRERVQAGFMDGSIRVIAATNAFGLGVDKPDVRFVVHRDAPANLEAYYQEAGRAGRDGAFARCTLIYRPSDVGRSASLSGGGRLTREELAAARPGLVALGQGTAAEIGRATGLSKGDVSRLIAVLKEAGLLAERRGRYRLREADFDPAAISLDREEHRIAYERSRAEMMRAYAETADCRRVHVLAYFGEVAEFETCGRCDNDVRPAEEVRVAVAPVDEPPADTAGAAFEAGQAVEHETWGPGVVQRVSGDELTVLFERAGYKTRSARLVRERGLLLAAAMAEGGTNADAAAS